MRVVTLGHASDLGGWRDAARRLLAAGVPPGVVDWRIAGAGEPQAARLACRPPTPPAVPRPQAAPTPQRPADAVRVPRAFLSLARWALRHSDPRRFALLYGLLWRIARGRPELLRLTTDPQVHKALTLARQAARDAHRMISFVRFRQVERADGCWLAAWYEPDHHVVEAVAPHFRRRLAAARWVIHTPRRSARWDGQSLTIGPGGPRPGWLADAAAPDMYEDAWLTFYASHFNPGRVNQRVLDKDMPRRFRANLPEARLVDGLVAGARKRP